MSHVEASLDEMKCSWMMDDARVMLWRLVYPSSCIYALLSCGYCEMMVKIRWNEMR